MITAGLLMTSLLVFWLYKTQQRSAPRPKAVILILCRNSELDDLHGTLVNFEARFNHKFGYPYVFLNDEPFSVDFRHKITALVGDGAQFGTVPREHWGLPTWINSTRAEEARRTMAASGVIYGGSLSYRHMCRYFSGFFYDHPLLRDYDYYWRVEPGVRFLCDIPTDPFLFMQENNKHYGFTLALLEIPETIPTLWSSTLGFLQANPNVLHGESGLGSMVTEWGDYDGCHFWSNFEIARFSLWRSPSYRSYFSWLDMAGGFFYERWGDAAVHSLAAAILLHPNQLHHFADIGYYHAPLLHCPANEKTVQRLRCVCKPEEGFNYPQNDCIVPWIQD